MGPHDLGLAGDETVGVYLVDIDRFKAINDVLGYESGDEVLHLTEERIAGWAGPRGFVTRVAGDMFAAICPGLADADDAKAEGERLRLLLAEPIRVSGQVITRSVSVGLAFGRLSEALVVELFRRADDAMEAAHRMPGNVTQLFDEDIRSQAVARSLIELHLRDALRTTAFELYFQPEVDLRTGTIVAVEALMRWRHPRLGLLGADKFIGVAEQTDVIGELGEWALREACRQRAAWQSEFPDLPLIMRVNMSPAQLVDARTPALVARVLEDTGVRGDQLCIEITEFLAAPDGPAVAEVLRQLRLLGVTAALDDFGAGYSSLIRLKAMPVDILKIDRAFISDLGSNPADEAIVRALVELAAAFGLELVAEGVETIEVAAELVRIGCWRAQGHLLASAMPAAEMGELLKAGRVRADVLPVLDSDH
jgi:diguanylate cyclase (GGDEF)-like protein